MVAGGIGATSRHLWPRRTLAHRNVFASPWDRQFAFPLRRDATLRVTRGSII